MKIWCLHVSYKTGYRLWLCHQYVFVAQPWIKHRAGFCQRKRAAASGGAFDLTPAFHGVAKFEKGFTLQNSVLQSSWYTALVHIWNWSKSSPQNRVYVSWSESLLQHHHSKKFSGSKVCVWLLLQRVSYHARATGAWLVAVCVTGSVVSEGEVVRCHATTIKSVLRLCALEDTKQPHIELKLINGSACAIPTKNVQIVNRITIKHVRQFKCYSDKSTQWSEWVYIYNTSRRQLWGEKKWVTTTSGGTEGWN